MEFEIMHKTESLLRRPYVPVNSKTAHKKQPQY